MPKIKQDRKKCIGCGSCVAICPENWELKEDGKASPKKIKIDKIGCNKRAAEVCPVSCIKIE